MYWILAHHLYHFPGWKTEKCRRVCVGFFVFTNAKQHRASIKKLAKNITLHSFSLNPSDVCKISLNLKQVCHATERKKWVCFSEYFCFPCILIFTCKKHTWSISLHFGLK